MPPFRHTAHLPVRVVRSSAQKAKPLWFRPLCFSENDGSVLLHLAPTPDGAGLTKGRKQDTCGSESWQIHRAVVCLPEPPPPDAGLRDSHKLSVWKRSVSPKTDRPPCNCSPHIIRQTINVSSIGRRLDAKLREQMKICVNSMLCLMARPQIHLPNVKTCLDVVNTYPDSVLRGRSGALLYERIAPAL